MIFVTVGSFAPFDRLIRAADELALDYPEHEWFAQIGEATYEPVNMAFERYIDKDEFDRRMREADAIIGHAGMGTITGAMKADRPLLVLPRDPKRGEHVDDHQAETAQVFGSGDHVLVAWTTEELRTMLPDTFDFRPTPRTPTPEAVADRIGTFLRSLR